MELPVRAPLLRLVLPFALGIALEDALECAPWLAAVLALAGLGLWRVRERGRVARVGEALLGLGLGAFALGVRLHAPVPEATDRPVALTAPSAAMAPGKSESAEKNGANESRRTSEGTCEHFKYLPACNVIRSRWVREPETTRSF